MDVLTDEMKEFQLKLEAILKEFLDEGRIEVYGNLKIVVTSFDRPSRIAFQKGNMIYVNIKARRYPEFVLKYIIAHELAHLAVKRHTWKFWKIVKDNLSGSMRRERKGRSGPWPWRQSWYD